MTEPLHITHCIGDLATIGGTTSALLATVLAQVEVGLRVGVVAPPSAGRTPTAVERMRAAGITVGPMAEYLERVESSPPAVIHVHGLWDKGLPRAGQLAKKLRVPFVVTPHGMATEWALRQKPLKKLLYRSLVLRRNWPSDAVMHFATAWERDRSPAWSSRQRSVVVPLCIDVDAITAASRSASGYWGRRVGGETPTLLFVGRVHPGKGVEYLIPAMRHIPKELGRLAIVGPADGAFAEGLRQQAADVDVGDRVHWIGPIHAPELYEAMGDAAALVLPSDHENFGLVAVEAIAAGVPALVSREVAIGAELVGAGAADWVAREPQTLGEELGAFLRDAERRTRMATAARRAAPDFGLAGVGRQWRQTYEDILRQRGSR